MSDTGSAAGGFVVGALADFRKWQSSLTLQGGMVAGAGTFVATKGPVLLADFGFDKAISGELATDVAAVMAAVGTLMLFIGRLRIGDLK